MKPFLTANWRYLAMLNYVVDPALIEPLVPVGTEIDCENGETFVSIVGFLFLDTRLLGLSFRPRACASPCDCTRCPCILWGALLRSPDEAQNRAGRC